MTANTDKAAGDNETRGKGQVRHYVFILYDALALLSGTSPIKAVSQQFCGH